jgi:predicted CoA-binding protein
MLDDLALCDLLLRTRAIAVVGHSPKPDRPSYQVAQFMREAGYTIYPVNPGQTEIAGLTCYPSLAAIPEPVEMVNVFRQSAYLREIAEEAIAIGAQTLWAQLGIHNDAAVHCAAAAGLTVITNACLKIEYQRLQIHR